MRKIKAIRPSMKSVDRPPVKNVDSGDKTRSRIDEPNRPRAKPVSLRPLSFKEAVGTLAAVGSQEPKRAKSK
jgi:hypothetical protein